MHPLETFTISTFKTFSSTTEQPLRCLLKNLGASVGKMEAARHIFTSAFQELTKKCKAGDLQDLKLAVETYTMLSKSALPKQGLIGAKPVIFPFKRRAKRLDMPRMLSRAFEDMPPSNQASHFLKRFIPIALLTTILSSCGIYDGGFQRGGELTSSFLERIQETEKDQEDYLMQKENKPCSK